MKKRWVTLVLIVSMVAAMAFLMGCSDGNISEGGSDGEAVGGSQEPDEEVDENKKEGSEKGKRSNPVGLGETVEWEVKFYADAGDWDSLTGLANVTLNEVYEGDEAVDMLYFGEEALDDVEEGYTYAVANMTVELVDGNEDIPYTTSFDIKSVSEEGRESPSSYTSLSDRYEENEYTDLYPGGSVDIMKAFLIPEDNGYLIEVEENISGEKFFRHE